MSASDARTVLVEAYEAAVATAHPRQVVPPHLPPLPRGRLVVIGAGKASAAMARAVERHYGDAAIEGLVITRYGHAVATDTIEIVEAGHPIPDENGRVATRRILDLLAGVGSDDTVICLLSGGGSALLTAPVGLDLQQLAEVNRELLLSGADIGDMNAVRKHLSAVKGGRLAQAAAPARLVTLVISDVVDDDLSVIASGPTVPDPTTFEQALGIVRTYGITSPAATTTLEQGVAGGLSETPKPGAPLFAAAETRLVASGQRSLEAAASVVVNAGFEPYLLSATITGEARTVGTMHAAIARQILDRAQPFAPPCALISGGETTVTVRSGGRGGRNGEFALALALGLPEGAPVYALAADTDGIDGSENNAGVFATPALFSTGSRLQGAEALAANDSYRVFASANHLLVRGPTYTNVNDLRILLIT